MIVRNAKIPPMIVVPTTSAPDATSSPNSLKPCLSRTSELGMSMSNRSWTNSWMFV
ncbi:hypothetical protein D3C74_421320 [compost metagenome]